MKGDYWMKKVFLAIIILLVLSLALTVPLISHFRNNENSLENSLDESLEEFLPPAKVQVPSLYSTVDKNNNGVADPIDICNNAKDQLKKNIKYKDAYYVGGYPPEDEGVCTDVIWRSFKALNIDLKTLMDNDIAKNIKDYSRVNGKPDPNIDFRRVVNQKVFFHKFLSSEVNFLDPNDIDNLSQWQPGDILLFLKPYEHVGIISDERDDDGIPFVIHNSHPEMKYSKLSWFSSKEIFHYRWKY